MLLDKKYLPDLMNSPIISNLTQMGVINMTQRVSTNHSLIAGRLQLFTQNWRVVTQDTWVLKCIEGYTIDLVSPPVQHRAPQELTFPQEEKAHLAEEVEKMLKKQAISVAPREHAAKGFLSQLFAVPQKDGGTRPIINLKGLNSFVQTVHFKMEGIHMVKDILKPGDWMTKVDLKDAYFMIPIAPRRQRELLQFQWQGTTYQFNCLPFGLSSAPWVFTKTTRPIVTILRSLGLRMIIIHRRHPDHGRLTICSKGAHSCSNLPSRKSRFHSQLPQIPSEPHTGNRNPGLHSELCCHGNQSAGQQNQTSPLRGKETPGSGRLQGHSLVTPPGQTEPCCASYPPSTPVLQEPTILPSEGVRNERGEGLLSASTADSLSNRGVEMVAATPYQMEWATHTHYLKPPYITETGKAIEFSRLSV